MGDLSDCVGTLKAGCSLDHLAQLATQKKKKKKLNTMDFFFLTALRGKIITKTHRTQEKSAEQAGTRGGEFR